MTERTRRGCALHLNFVLLCADGLEHRYSRIMLGHNLLNMRTKHQIPKHWKTEALMKIQQKGPKYKRNSCRRIKLQSIKRHHIKKKQSKLLSWNFWRRNSAVSERRSKLTPYLLGNRFWNEIRRFNFWTLLLFIDYGEASDNVSWENLWQILRYDNIRRQLLKEIRGLYIFKNMNKI